MKMYLSVFRIRFINNLQYRAVALGAIITRFAWGFMEILAYAMLYRASNAVFPMELSQTVSYIWMQQTLIVLFSVVFSDGEIYSAIGSGSIAYELVRPMNLYGRWFCQSAANRVAFTMLNCLPALLVALIIPKPYRMSLPLGMGQFFLFLLSVVLALCVVVAFAMLMYISLFYTLSHRGVRVIVTALTTFLSGGVIPLPFFPAPVLAVVRLLPFAAMQNMPLLIYSGNIAGVEALKGIVFQLFWLATLFIIGQLTMQHSLKRVIVQGG
ncbi:ABC transporter permease [Anaerocolumna sedimenticola]|uniref:ABC transporter permease n=1 Tax=Anaerocolumna sedimenticola TaxID=2696063 RepID=A0A6P1TGL2_9FIRM|nr:ABC transporter permease [Anaerocolumna sedimenticola]QHQ59563.1 ABC transporter permease [Anaerocolumna sedimenticola]